MELPSRIGEPANLATKLNKKVRQRNISVGTDIRRFHKKERSQHVRPFCDMYLVIRAESDDY